MFSISDFEKVLGNNFVAADDLKYHNEELSYLIVNYAKKKYHISVTKSPASTLKTLMRAFTTPSNSVRGELLYQANRDEARIIFFKQGVKLKDLYPLLDGSTFTHGKGWRAPRSEEGELFVITHNLSKISAMCFRGIDQPAVAPVSAFRSFYVSNIRDRCVDSSPSITIKETIDHAVADDFKVVRLIGIVSFSDSIETVRDFNYHQAIKAITSTINL